MPKKKRTEKKLAIKLGDLPPNYSGAPMNKYIVKVYIATDWSLLTQADHYSEYRLESAESLPDFAKRLAIFGFQADENRWIMPGAMLEVRKDKKR
jgi:hypothetical protein